MKIATRGQSHIECRDRRGSVVKCGNSHHWNRSVGWKAPGAKPVGDSYLHLFDTERKTWSDLWPELARHLGESGEPWERSAWRAEPRFTALCGESGGYWIGSPRGLFHYDPPAHKFRTFLVPGALCPDKIIATERLIIVAAALPGLTGVIVSERDR